MIERELDTMYISNSSLIFGHGYVRSVVMKFIQGQYRMQHLTSTTSTTTTTTTTSTTTTKPLRVGREVPDMMRDYFYDFTGEKSWRDDKKVFVGARGYWPYDGTETMSTQAWVEHQFVGVRSRRASICSNNKCFPPGVLGAGVQRPGLC